MSKSVDELIARELDSFLSQIYTCQRSFSRRFEKVVSEEDYQHVMDMYRDMVSTTNNMATSFRQRGE